MTSCERRWNTKSGTTRKRKPKLQAYGGIDPATIGKLQTLPDNPTSKAVAEFVESAVGARLSLATRDHTKKIAELTGKVETLAKESSERKAALDNAKLAQSVEQAGRSAHVTEAVLSSGDLLTVAKSEGFTVDPKGLVKNADGLDLQSWLDQRKATSPHWWSPSRGAGARPDTHDRGIVHNNKDWKTMTLTEKSQIMRTDPVRAARLEKLANG